MDIRFLAAYALALVIWIGEIPTFRGRRPEARPADRGSIGKIRWLFGAGYFGAFMYRYWLVADSSLAMAHVIRALELPRWSLAVGAALVVAGTLFRNWAVRTLGRYFTRTVQVSDDQPVVENGPYRWLRHPSYTGGAVAAAGVGVALGSVVTVVAIVIPVAIAYAVRIPVEEAALCETLGDRYREYMKRTWRLVPFVY